MPPYILSPLMESPLRRAETIHQRRDRLRGVLKIRTPQVTEADRKRWYGMPPSKIETKRPGGTITF